MGRPASEPSRCLDAGAGMPRQFGGVNEAGHVREGTVMPEWMRHTAGVIYTIGVLNCIAADKWIWMAFCLMLVLLLAVEVR